MLQYINLIIYMDDVEYIPIYTGNMSKKKAAEYFKKVKSYLGDDFKYKDKLKQVSGFHLKDDKNIQRIIMKDRMIEFDNDSLTKFFEISRCRGIDKMKKFLEENWTSSQI